MNVVLASRYNYDERGRMMARPVLAAAVLGALALMAPSREARADNVSPDGKGVVGGALLGAGAVTIVESLVGVRAGWAYAVGALAGAGGGGVGGYFVEKGSTDGKAPMYMLAGGLAIIIPALVLTLNATRYMPEEGATEDRTPIEPAAEPGVPGGSVTGGTTDVAPPPPPPTAPPAGQPPASPPPATPAKPPQSSRVKAPPSGGVAASLVDVYTGGLRVGVPVPDVYRTFTPEQQRQYGMRDVAELRLPVLHVTF
jgi:MFS family permease